MEGDRVQQCRAMKYAHTQVPFTRDYPRVARVWQMKV